MELLGCFTEYEKGNIRKGWAVFMLSENTLNLLRKDALDIHDVIRYYYIDMLNDLGLKDAEFSSMESCWEMRETVTLSYEGTVRY